MTDKTVEGEKEKKGSSLWATFSSRWQIPWGLCWERCVCLTFPFDLLQLAEILINVVSNLQVFYFFLPKKLNLFSRSFSFPSLLRMVTPPASPELGEMGGIVMARLRAQGPPGESDDPVGMELRMDWIQELISNFRQKKKNILFITQNIKKVFHH